MCYDCGKQAKDIKKHQLDESRKKAEEEGKILAKQNGWPAFGIYWTINKDKYVARELNHPRLELVQTVYI